MYCQNSGITIIEELVDLVEIVEMQKSISTKLAKLTKHTLNPRVNYEKHQKRKGIPPIPRNPQYFLQGDSL